jgi:hypothetical protein
VDDTTKVQKTESSLPPRKKIKKQKTSTSAVSELTPEVIVPNENKKDAQVLKKEDSAHQTNSTSIPKELAKQKTTNSSTKAKTCKKHAKISIDKEKLLKPDVEAYLRVQAADLNKKMLDKETAKETIKPKSRRNIIESDSDSDSDEDVFDAVIQGDSEKETRLYNNKLLISMAKSIEGLLPLLTKGKLTPEKRQAVNKARIENNQRLIEMFDKEEAI